MKTLDAFEDVKTFTGQNVLMATGRDRTGTSRHVGQFGDPIPFREDFLDGRYDLSVRFLKRPVPPGLAN